MKYLSVIIPFYNSADTLEKAAMSCLDSRILDDIEVIMVNDGSKDNSLEVARSIEKQYPESVIVIDKPNGGKGSCMNAGITKATGKYLRELDSDDYFASGSIYSLICKIKDLQIDTDVIYTNYQFVYLDTDTEEVNRNNSIIYDEVLNLKEAILPNLSYRNYQMHALTYKTDFLHKIGFLQSEGISFTDTEYVYYPLTRASTLIGLDITLYSYCIGVEGQSISIKSMLKKQSHFWKLFDRYMNDSSYLNENASAITIRRNIMDRILTPLLEMYTIYDDYNEEYDRKMRNALKKVKDSDAKIFYRALSVRRKTVIFPCLMWYFMGKLYFKLRGVRKNIS